MFLKFVSDGGLSTIFVPRSIRYLGLGLHPQPKLVEILHADMPVAHSVDEMIPNGSWKP